MPSVLFVCTGNLYRSPMAAAFFHRKLQESGQAPGWVVESAGTWTLPGQPVPESVLRMARRLDVDLRDHITRQVDRDLLMSYDLVLVMERGHKEALGIEFPFVHRKLHLLSEMGDQLAYDIPDPCHAGEDFAEVARQISGLVDRGFQRICLLTRQAGR